MFAATARNFRGILRPCMKLLQKNDIGNRGYKSRKIRPVLSKLYKQRLKLGPEEERHRSEWITWNYDAEIYAFGRRLGEEFNDTTLKTAFRDRSCAERELAKRQEVELSDITDGDIADNSELAELGEQVSRDYVHGYLRLSCPALPEEGISAIGETLMTDDIFAHIAENLGISDLILCEEMKPNTEVLSRTLRAVIGALATDQGVARAQMFVLDFLVVQLVGRTLCEMWSVTDPMGTLRDLLQKDGHTDLQSRLMFEMGGQTVVAAYMVGVYSDKRLLGKGYGETTSIAEEMAARDALNQLFKITPDKEPFKFGVEGHNLNVDVSKMNPTLQQYTAKQLQS